MNEACISVPTGSAGDRRTGPDQAPGAKQTVLIVDDEQGSLDLLQRTLRGFYLILRAGDGSQGMEYLGSQPVAAVIADQRMPGMSGVEFLTRACRSFPFTQRILLTGYTEVEGLVEAINSGRVFGYLAKPWHPADLLSLLRRAVDTHRLLCEKERLLEDLKRKNQRLEQLLEETRRLEEQRLQAERWAALGKLAGMVAHDLRNPLAAILCHAGLIEQSALDGPVLQNSPKAICRQVELMRTYIDELLLFSRPREAGETAKAPYPVRELLVALEEAFSLRCRQRQILFETGTSYDGTILVDSSRIRRVLENLLQNALEAVEDGGRIRLHARLEQGLGVVVRVEDSGPGVPPEIRDTLFEPFVTRNKQGGTGLGLAIVKKILEENGGRVWVETGTLNGACFSVLLPLPPLGVDGQET